MKTPEQLHQAAVEAATKAAAEHDKQLGPEILRGLDCGFASVLIRPARGAFVKYCRDNKIGYRKDWGSGGGWIISCSGFHPTQSISTHQAAATAFMKVLAEAGLSVTTESRYD